MPNPASPLTMEEVDEVSVMSSTLVDYVNSSLRDLFPEQCRWRTGIHLLKSVRVKEVNNWKSYIMRHGLGNKVLRK